LELRHLDLAEKHRHHRLALIVALALSLACHESHERQEREAALHHDLAAMRKAIAEFRADKKRGPHSLAELRETKYLHVIPIDSITNVANWRVTTEAAVRNDDFAAGAAPATEAEVIDVHSRAVGRDAAGRLYSEY
jgi:hypothetical protein